MKLKQTGAACWIALAGIFLATLAPLRAQIVSSFDDIVLWAGTGSNRAALVIQWNDGGSPVSLAWGFRWDGSATGMDMLTAVAGLTTFSGYPTTNPPPITGLDSRLTVGLEYSASFGDYVYSIEFNDSGTLRTQADWLSGYWEYYNMGGTFDTPPDGNPNTFPGSASYPGTNSTPDWTSSWTGAGSRGLTDGSWDGWSFAGGFNGIAIAQPVAAVPEPAVTGLLLFSGVFLFRYARKRLHSS